MPREGSLPARSRSRSPEQWNKVAEDKAVPASAELQKGTTSSDRRTAAGGIECNAMPNVAAMRIGMPIAGMSTSFAPYQYLLVCLVGTELQLSFHTRGNQRT